MSRWPANVERWRTVLSRFFKPGDVDKALHVMNYESGGNPGAVGDGGSSIGLFQLHSRGVGSGMSAAQRRNPEANIRAAANAVYNGPGWAAWGEGNTYNGRPFGALGNHPYDRGGGARSFSSSGRQQSSAGQLPPLPVSGGRTTQVFGPTGTTLDSGYNGYKHFNKGWDVSVPVGTPVVANVPGTVVNAGDAGDGWGISVKVRDGRGNVHSYGHMSQPAVRVGQTVNVGQNLGKSGNTGKSTGPHLSYDVRNSSGRYIDPSPWLGFNAAGDNRKGVSGNLHQSRSAQGSGALTYEAGGEFNTDASNYFSLAQAAWNELSEYQRSAGYPVIIDEAQRAVYSIQGYDEYGQPVMEVDSHGTSILNQAIMYEEALERLYAARKAGLIDNGQDAAAAYLESEERKAAEATRKYEDYVGRVGDLAAIEDRPRQQRLTLANTLAAINQANEKKGKLGAGMVASGGKEFEDFSPFAEAIRQTIPDKAPELYEISDKALEPFPTGGFVARSPEEILGGQFSGFGGGGAVGSPGFGAGNIPWSQHPGELLTHPNRQPPPNNTFQAHPGQRVITSADSKIKPQTRKQRIEAQKKPNYIGPKRSQKFAGTTPPPGHPAGSTKAGSIRAIARNIWGRTP